MNREEAATIIKAIGKHAIDTHLTDPGDIVDATVMAVKALVPKPDEVTGLVPCGCGGKARFYAQDDGFHIFGVECSQCYVATPPTCDEENATHDWNRAMGWKGGAE